MGRVSLPFRHLLFPLRFRVLRVAFRAPTDEYPPREACRRQPMPYQGCDCGGTLPRLFILRSLSEGG